MSDQQIVGMMQVANQKKWRAGVLHVGVGSTGVGAQRQLRIDAFNGDRIELRMFIGFEGARRLWRLLQEAIRQYEQPTVLLLPEGGCQVIENEVVRVTDDINVVDHCPGDMTRYRVVASKLPRGVGGGEGTTTWCVAFPDMGGAYYVNEGATIGWRYIAEKFRAKHDLNEHTAIQMAHAIARVVPGVTVHA